MWMCLGFCNSLYAALHFLRSLELDFNILDLSGIKPVCWNQRCVFGDGSQSMCYFSFKCTAVVFCFERMTKEEWQPLARSYCGCLCWDVSPSNNNGYLQDIVAKFSACIAVNFCYIMLHPESIFCLFSAGILLEMRNIFSAWLSFFKKNCLFVFCLFICLVFFFTETGMFPM